MSGISSIFGSGNKIGQAVQFGMAAPVNFSRDGEEYLALGSIKTYDSSYSQSIQNAPELGVYGAARSSLTALYQKVVKVGATYCWMGSAIAPGYSAAWSSAPSVATGGSTTNSDIASSGTYAVITQAANTAPVYTSNGSTYAAVGGTFTTFTSGKVIAYGNNIWVAATTLNGTAGELGYISSANPSGAWTVGTASVGISTLSGICFGGGLFVAFSQGGAIATTANGSAWTARAAPSGTTAIGQMAYTGAAFIAGATVNGSSVVIRSSDGINWSVVPGITPDIYSIKLSSDGAGAVLMVHGSTSLGAVGYVSSDHGLTWNRFSLNAPTASMNGAYSFYDSGTPRFYHTTSATFVNPTSNNPATQDPEYIGSIPTISGFSHARIK